MRKIVSLLSVLLLCCALAFGQTRKITGIVRDDKGDPIPFATITEAGTRNAAQADVNGAFTITIGPNSRLTVTATGHNAQTLTPSGNVANVNLTTSQSQLSEVVVTALGIQRQAKELGYSTSKVGAKDLVQARPLQVQNGLTGKVAGLQINTVNNGVFAPTRITLRGNRSITGNNQPLIVVDGSIFYGDLSTLNPDDISDINILKGASASAIYGSDASNGVIIVSTKKGVRGKPSLTFTTTTQLETVSYLPKLQNQFGSNGGEAFVNDFGDLSTYVPYENQSYGPAYNGAIVPIGRPVQGLGGNFVPYIGLPNEKRNFFDKGITEQNNISYQAGDESSRFFLSAQDVSTKGVMPKDIGHRDVFRVGGSKTYGIFSAQYSLAYTYKFTNLTNTGTVYQLVMNTPAHIPLTKYKDWRNNAFASINGFYNDYFDNPYWAIDNNRNKTTDNVLTGNVQLNLKPTNWLTLTYRLSMNNINERYQFLGGGKQYSTYARTSDTVLYSTPTGNGVDTVHESPKYIAGTDNRNPSYSTSTFNNFLLTSDFIASVDKNITSNFNLKATAGATYIDNKINYTSINAGTLSIPTYNVASRTGLPTLGEFNDTARKLGFFGEATLGYKSFAFLHGSYRGDIDSRLSKANRFIPYYDVDAAIVLSEIIPGMKESRAINYLKLRLAHSVTGNASALAGGSQFIGFGAYRTTATFNSAAGYPFNVPGYLLNASIANPDIKPEKVTENEVGLEFGFWQNRGTLVLSGYKSELTEGIVFAQIPTSSGFTTAIVNAAHTSNNGVEAELKVDVVRSRDFTWNLGVNWTHNVSKVLSINGGLQSLAIANATGGANGNAFAVVGYSYPVIETRDWVRDSSGHVIVDAVTGNPKQDPALKILGNATPKDIVGITSSFTYKRLSIAITADYRGGYKIFNSIGQYMDFTGISYVTAQTGRQRFVWPNSVYFDGSKYVPNTNITVDDANFNFWPGLWRSVGANYVISAAAWKLREVAISYDIPRSVFAATKVINRASITLSGRNLLMIRPKTNQWTDPEFNETTGNDIGRTSENQLPPTRIFSATLSITF